VTELTDSFALLKKTLQNNDGTDNKLESQSITCNKDESVVPDKDIQSEASNPADTGRDISLMQCHSSHELETIIIFNLCALSEIATSKSAILRVRV